MASENLKALRSAFREKLGEVKKKARMMRAESLMSDDDEDKTEIVVSKKDNAPDRDSPKKEEKEPKSEKIREMREEVEEFLTKPRKVETGKVKSVVAAPSEGKKPSVFRPIGNVPDKKKGRK